jgi:hypothetical protein
MVSLAVGQIAAVQMLGFSNVVFGVPAISPGSVILSSAAGIAIALVLLTRISLRAELACDHPDIEIPRQIKLVAVLALIPYAGLLLDSFWSFPNGTDALGYHLNLALRLLQTGSMRMDTSLGWQYAMPANAELPALLALAAGVPNAAAMGNLLAAVLLAFSVYLIALKITGSSAASLLAAVVSNSIPMVLYQSFELYVDLFGTAFLVAAIAFLVWRERSPLAFTFLSACAVGVAIGSKPVFWIYGAIYAITAAAVALAGARRMAFTLLLGTGLLLPSLFWFFRAAEATGNPLYPMLVPSQQSQSTGFTPDVLTGVHYSDNRFEVLLSALTYPWTEVADNDGIPFGSDRGTGPLFAAIAAPGVMFLLILILRGRRLSLEAVLLLANGAMLIVWAIRMRVPRFGLPVMALSSALAAPMLKQFVEKFRRLLVSVCIACLLLNDVFCLAGPGLRVVRRVQAHDWSRAAYYGYPPLIDRLPPGTRILNGTPFQWDFILAGAALTNSVRHAGGVGSIDYVVKAGAKSEAEAALSANGATLIYDATPPNLFPKTAQHWRIYRVAR